MPMKFSGWKSWIIIALTSTKSPIECVPERMPAIDIIITAVMPIVKINV